MNKRIKILVGRIWTRIGRDRRLTYALLTTPIPEYFIERFKILRKQPSIPRILHMRRYEQIELRDENTERIVAR